ncbi:sulfite exporter TauE/SafE family protein [Legionella sp. W05-934-2]|uniref:sulfite exporter TauE/SafE family protein n=1 Tax=Legionella sp. W05-934-2 TaxID=1198649 RepID=UPI0034631D1D
MSQFLFFIVVGFIAQVIDGALGMAYGVISTSILVGTGISPMVASAAVHTAEIVTTGISGLSHAMFKNIDIKLFKLLAIPGIIGSITGAIFLTKLPLSIATPFIATYLFMMGCFILYRALRRGRFSKNFKSLLLKKVEWDKLPSEEARGLLPLGFVGGFFDAAGGGGWGSIVNSTLLAQGTTPRFTIGSVNFTEFLITLSISATFLLTIGITHWTIIFGLIVGGAIAAPFAAWVVRFIEPRVIMISAGILVIFIGIRMIVQIFL